VLEQNKPVKFASCCFVVDCNDMILLTQRSPTMRSFPNCWVVPGGMIESADLSLEDTARRELWEECGIDLRADMTSSPVQPFFLYESVFPADLSTEDLKSQVLVVFCVARLFAAGPSLSLQLSKEEVFQSA